MAESFYQGHACVNHDAAWHLTLGEGEGPGEARLVVVLPQVPFLLLRGGVLHPNPNPCPERFLAAADHSPEGMDLLRAAL